MQSMENLKLSILNKGVNSLVHYGLCTVIKLV